jgi:hypothetical protein
VLETQTLVVLEHLVKALQAVQAMLVTMSAVVVVELVRWVRLLRDQVQTRPVVMVQHHLLLAAQSLTQAAAEVALLAHAIQAQAARAAEVQLTQPMQEMAAMEQLIWAVVVVGQDLLARA